MQPTLYKDPTLRARVPRALLEGGNVGPFSKSILSRLARRLYPKAAVKVEKLSTSGLTASVLYAPEGDLLSSDCPFVPTELPSGPPSGNLVYTDSPFEIRVAGMLVKNYDRWVPRPSADNELLMYSVERDPSVPNGEGAESLPFIHFDHRSDAYHSIERPNTYVPIPASKSFVTGSSGKKQSGGTARSMNQKSVNVQFKIIELDTPGESVKQAISGIDELGGAINTFSMSSPSLGILSPALSLAGSLSKKALESYAKPDKVISIDMDFLIADRARVENNTAPPGEYLRYGYYFFLSDPLESKLYASVLTPKNVQLMLRRADKDKHIPRDITGKPVESRKFFPLTQVSYLVVRVAEPTCSGERRRKPIQKGHARELEDIFSMAKSKENPENVQRAIKDLGIKLGVLNSESEGEDE